MKIVALIDRLCGDHIDYEVMRFSSYDEMLEWMLNECTKWDIRGASHEDLERAEHLLGRKLKPDERFILLSPHVEYNPSACTNGGGPE